MSQGIKYTICYKQERDEALAQVKELKAENKKGAAKPRIIKPEYNNKSFCFILKLYYFFRLYFS